jgi:predicted NBD/HSP70 family sugar kinase
MGQMNKRALISRLRKLGVASRADLAKSLGLSQPTAGKIVDQLLEIGVFEEISENGHTLRHPAKGTADAPKLGRPARMLRLDRERPRFLGIHLGVSETQIALLPFGADTEDYWTIHLPAAESAALWLQQIKKAASTLRQKDFDGVLVSVPGVVDEQASKVLFSPNLHWTEKANIESLIQKVWNAPVLVVQEERALALGHQAVDPKADDFLLVDFGEGVGGAVVLGGKLADSPLPLSGELGHMPVMGNLRQCGCGGRGCLETLVSMRGLLQSFAEAEPDRTNNWAALCYFLAEHGVVPWLARTLDATGIAIAGALNVLGVRRVVITGIIPQLPPVVLEHLTETITQGAMWARFGDVEFVSAPRRRAAGLVAMGIDQILLPMNSPQPSELPED